MWLRAFFYRFYRFYHHRGHIHILTREKEMGNRYLKSEVLIIKEMYPSASKADILAALPGRDWTPIGRYARYRLGLHRTRKAIGLAVLAGLAEGKRKREEEAKRLEE